MTSSVQLRANVDINFIERLQALSLGENGVGDALRSALSGDGAAVETQIQRALSAGAQGYVKALSNLNFAISMVNLAGSDLLKLKDLTTGMIELAEDSADENTSSQARERNDKSLQELALDFKEILRKATFQDRRYLHLKSHAEVLTEIGLDPLDNNSVRELINSFYTVGTDKELASPDVDGGEPYIPRGIGLPSSTQSTTDVLSPTRGITTRADAYAMLTDLTELQEQIDQNLVSMESSRQFLADNFALSRAAAIAMDEISRDITSEVTAQDVANQLRQAIKKLAKDALAQAENLEPLIVAALTNDDVLSVNE